MRLRAALTAAALAAPWPALALDLVWNAPAPCPGRDVALAHLRAAADTNRRLAARTTVTRDGARGAWTLRLETDDGTTSTERELSSPSCDELTDAAVLLLALALDAVDVDPPTDPAPRPGAAPVVARIVRANGRTRGGVRASVGLSVGVLPSPSLAASLRVWIARGRWRVEVAAALLPAQVVTLAGGASAELRAAQVGLRVCRSLTRAPFELAACAGADVALLQGRSAGVLRTAEGASTLASLTAGTTLTWRVTRTFAAVASVEGAWAVERPRFVILGVGEVHTSAPASLAASVGAETSW